MLIEFNISNIRERASWIQCLEYYIFKLLVKNFLIIFPKAFFREYPNNVGRILHMIKVRCKNIAFMNYVILNRANPSVYMVAAELCYRPISKSANQADYGRVSRVSNSDTTASKEREYLAWGQTSKHTSSTHTSADSFGLTRSRTHARTHTRARVQDSYGATNDWNDLHSMSNQRSLSVFHSASPRPSARSSSPFGLARVTFSEGGAGLI